MGAAGDDLPGLAPGRLAPSRPPAPRPPYYGKVGLCCTGCCQKAAWRFGPWLGGCRTRASGGHVVMFRRARGCCPTLSCELPTRTLAPNRAGGHCVEGVGMELPQLWSRQCTCTAPPVRGTAGLQAGAPCSRELAGAVASSYRWCELVQVVDLLGELVRCALLACALHHKLGRGHVTTCRKRPSGAAGFVPPIHC
jgi:hypothetical protein